MPKVLKIAGEEYEEISDLAINASGWLTDIWIRLGKPETPLSPSGEKLLAAVIAAWEELYPVQSREWKEARKEYKENEMTIHDQVTKRTGRSLASYPFPIFAMMRKFFPNFRTTERENCMRLVAKFPMFRLANKV